MSRRATLHIPDLAAFEGWLTAEEIPHKPGAARYEALQLWVRIGASIHGRTSTAYRTVQVITPRRRSYCGLSRNSRPSDAR